MRRLLLPLLLLLLFFSAYSQPTEKIGYYYQGQKVYFPVSYDRIVVGMKPGNPFGKIKNTIAGLLNVPADSISEGNNKQLLIKLGHNKVKDIRPYLAKLKLAQGLSFARPVFKSPSENYCSYGDEFIVNLKATTTWAMLQSLMKKNGCTLVRKYSFQDDMYILAAGPKSNYDGLAMANSFFETNLFDYAEPNKIVYGALHVAPTDPLYNLQWAHKNTGSAEQYSGTAGTDMKVEEAWAISMGSPNIKIGVIDEGVDLTHPDLQANLLQGFNGQTMTSNPGDGGPHTTEGAHGTNCAGIVAAIANNGIGVAGIAPNCKIIPAVIFGGVSGDYLGDVAVAASFDYVRTNGADVISNSWGGGPVSSTIDDAIHRAVTLGRNGKGCVVLFSSGNDNSKISYPSTNPEVIAVGGINMCNQRKSPGSCDGENWWGANYGKGLCVVAPCVKIASTDIQGTGGYNHTEGVDGDYHHTFNGTSSACPNAAGVVALMLSVNPALTVAEVTRYLELSADKSPLYTFTPTAGLPNGTWNNELGYGSVNALEALTLVSSCALPTFSGITLTQIVCPTPLGGSIEIQASGEGMIEYSIDGGTSWFTTNTFSSLSPGNYNVAVRYAGAGPRCYQFYPANPVVINKPVSGIEFTAPVVSQPFCPSTYTGQIEINASGTETLEYSLNGGEYQPSNIFDNLAPGQYNISTRMQGTLYCAATYSSAVTIFPINTSVSTVSYTGPAVAIPDNSAAGVNIPLTVTGLGSTLIDLDFRLDADPAGTCDQTVGNPNAAVDHSFAHDLVFKLTSPSGKNVILINQIPNSAKNFCNVLLDDDGGYPSIQDARMKPITGNFSPASALSLFDGEDPNGTWILNVSDRWNSNTGSVRRFSLVITAAGPCPAITMENTVSSFSACPSSPSSEQTITVSGTNLKDNLVVTAPDGFEVSLTPGSDFGNTVSIAPTTGNVPNSTVYVRMAAGIAGTYSGNLTCNSINALAQEIPLSGTINDNTLIHTNPQSVNILVLDNTSFSIEATGTGTLGYQWQVSSDNGNSFVNISDNAMYSGTSGSTLMLTGVSFAMNNYQYQCVVNGDCGMTTSTAATLRVIERRPTIITYSGDDNEQYSDLQTLAATLTDQATGYPLSGKVITFSLGTQSVTATTNASGVATATLRMYQDIGNYHIVCTFTKDDLYDNSSDTDPFSITKEKAITEYTGPEFISVPCATCATTNVLLSTSIVDNTDGYRGDIRKARVKFINLENMSDISEWLTPGLANGEDTTNGIVTYNWTTNIPNSGYEDYPIGVVVDNNGVAGNYKGYDHTVINVSRSSLTEFITGGGNILSSNSGGEYASDVNRKINFGFNVKYNKTGKKLQGNMNIIFRRGDHVYQIKATSMNSLSINSANPCSQKATFVSKANLVDITDPDYPVTLYGGITLQVTITDNGDQGKNDLIGITLLDHNNLVFSSNWAGKKTAEQVLNSGNLAVKSGTECSNFITAKPPEIAAPKETTSPAAASINVHPNPFSTQTSFTYTLPAPTLVSLEVYNVMGKKVTQLDEGFKVAGEHTISFASGHLVAGTYIYTLKTTDTDGKVNVLTGKLILLQ